MSLSIDSQFDNNENKWIFKPEGDLDIYTSSQFKEEVLKNFNAIESDIIIDGGKLDYVDSTGLGALISILRTMKEKETKIYIENVKPNIRKIFDITNLDKLFIFRGEENE
ncbi:STAS domain-containing protein [Tissierella creatinophila]|uniref:Anti-sigma factor antagonist n=1 Tax=Tissierella creatinophila DSM 6911 TaxID=1123403 RepID=A0A1U7M619_TISCR|nr:STAS domain-containing protein [Tissierella creatinophila]OLS02726.1 putative anti-sigma factor antagonist [Tissierella creatinophila DSM 6911]